MTIPTRFQLFASPVVLSDKDAARLEPYVASWRQLHPVIHSLNVPDLRRLVVMELMNRRRWQVVQRLLGRLGSLERERLETKVREMCR